MTNIKLYPSKTVIIFLLSIIIFLIGISVRVFRDTDADRLERFGVLLTIGVYALIASSIAINAQITVDSSKIERISILKMISTVKKRRKEFLTLEGNSFTKKISLAFYDGVAVRNFIRGLMRTNTHLSVDARCNEYLDLPFQRTVRRGVDIFFLFMSFLFILLGILLIYY